MVTDSRPVNVVVVVLDCVRATDFPGGSADAPRMPFCESLRKESVDYPRTISPSPWTIPSHAALFTGRTPWDIGCHWRGDLHLAPSVVRYPSVFARHGYRTMSLSANPLLEPSFGMSEGFEQAAWAGWWEPYLRFRRSVAPHELRPRGPRREGMAASLRKKQPVDRAVKESRSLFVRHPFVLDGGSRVVQGLRGEDSKNGRGMARWIEPTFARWVNATPTDQPIFAFVNLLDAHEPYFRGGNSASRTSSWWKYATARQDAWMAWQWKPSQETLDLLHELYRQMIAEMDARIQALVETLRASGRWDSTAFFVTADHGQEFGEHGVLFHMLRVDEQLLRIPLLARWPGGANGGSVAKGWASLQDIVGSAARLAGIGNGPAAGSVDLATLLDAERTSPAVAISDGIVWEHIRSKLNPERMAQADRVLGAAYTGSRKVVFDAVSGQKTAFDIDRDPLERHDIWDDSDAVLRSLGSEAEGAAQGVLHAARAGLSDAVESRLESWGYL